MRQNQFYRWMIVQFAIVLLAFLSCEKLGKKSPTGIDATTTNQAALKSALPAYLSSTPDIFVTTTSDVADFGGAQQVSDLPGPDGVVSLREAITAANNTTGPNVIGFNIPTSDPGFDGSVFVIKPSTSLPPLTDDAITINGATQTVYSGNTNPAGPEIVVNGSSMTYPAQGFIFDNSSQSWIHGLTVNGFNGPACDTTPIIPISIGGGRDNRITGCFVGIDPTGSRVEGGTTTGIGVQSSGNQIGGTAPEERNIIAGFCYGVQVQWGSDNIVEGNYLGTDVTGTQPIGNHVGVLIVDSQNQIISNLISGNSDGIRLHASDNLVVENYIGTDPEGGAALGNDENGVSIIGDRNTIRGNVISGNGHFGICVYSANQNVIEGNLIGTDASGTTALANGMGGIQIQPGPAGPISSENRIGGTSPSASNLISGNQGLGICIIAGRNNVIQGNKIGTNREGTSAIGNSWAGISLQASGNDAVDGAPNNLIGGTTPGAGNLISGNGYVGISIVHQGSCNNVVQGNKIGTDSQGRYAIPNKTIGIHIIWEANNNLIGGTTPASRNLISGNGSGITMGVLAVANIVQGNFIGTDITGSSPLGNVNTGVLIYGETTDNLIGGDSPHAGNIVAFNNHGILIRHHYSTTLRKNRISHNSIFSNSNLGIDLSAKSTPPYADGVNPNDPGDADSGPNDLMNYPVLTSAQATPGKLIVNGMIDTPNPKSVTLEFFANPVPNPGGDPTGHGEGAIYLGSDWPNPQGKFTATLPTVAPGTLITATATDAEGNTSEFAANIVAKGPGN